MSDKELIKCTLLKSLSVRAVSLSDLRVRTEKIYDIKTISQNIKGKETSNMGVNNADYCIKCDQPIKNYKFYSLRTDDNGTIEGRSKGLKEPLYFCSGTCLDDFQEQNDNVKEYQLYEITRCSSYYDCLKINNLRPMCTEEQRLDYEPESFSLLSNFKTMNFCKPADAGIIKVSLNIHKQLEESAKQIEESAKHNLSHFKITACMTVLVIILTIINTWIAYNGAYGSLFNDIIETLGLINDIIITSHIFNM